MEQAATVVDRHGRTWTRSDQRASGRVADGWLVYDDLSRVAGSAGERDGRRSPQAGERADAANTGAGNWIRNAAAPRRRKCARAFARAAACLLYTSDAA